MNPIVLIPARMASTRLPGKPLADVCGTPMIVHVLNRALEADIGPVAVATDADDIASAVRAAGGTSILTRSDHTSGSDRIHEALLKTDPDRRHDVIVNVQGDLPQIEPRLISAVLEPLKSETVAISTLAAEITIEDEKTNPNVVKAIGTPVSPRRLRALYFTRATAPTGAGPLYHHIGLYGYRRDALEQFVSLPPGALEQREKLEQLRALEAGMRIDIELVDTVPFGVDSPDDLVRARKMLSHDNR